MKTQAQPFLQREVSTLQVSLNVSQIINTLEQAKQGDLLARADLFSSMETLDAHIYSEIFKRKMAVSSLDWNLQPPRNALAREKKAIAELENTLRDNLDISTLVFNLADAIGKGFACIEIEWARNQDGFWLPKHFYFRPQFWFTTDLETRQQIRLRDYQSIDGVELIANGWLVHRHSSSSEESIGDGGLYSKLALPFLFKNYATKNWLRFCELYGVPLRVLLSNETDVTKKREQADALKSIGREGVAVINGAMKDEFITVDITKGEGQGFQNLIDWCEKSVSKAILGGTLTSQADGKTSTNALGNVHNDVRTEIREFDARQIAETINNQLINVIVKLNGLNIAPKFTFDTQEPEDIALFADAIPKLVAIGMKISPEYLHEKLKIPMAEEGADVLSTNLNVPTGMNTKAGLSALSQELPMPKFTPAQQVIEELADNVLANLNSPIPEKAIFNAIKAAKDYDDLADRLAVLFVETDTTEFRTVLERATFAADALGFCHA